MSRLAAAGDAQRYVLRRSLRRPLFGLLGSSIFLCLGTLLIASGESFAILWGILCIAIFCLLGARGAEMIVRGGRVVVDAAGIFDTRIMSRPVPWSAVLGFDAFDPGRDVAMKTGVCDVYLHVDKPDQYRCPVGPVETLMRRLRLTGEKTTAFKIETGTRRRTLDFLAAAARYGDAAARQAHAKFAYEMATEDAPLHETLRGLEDRAATAAEKLDIAERYMLGLLPSPGTAATDRLIDEAIALDSAAVGERAKQWAEWAAAPHDPGTLRGLNTAAYYQTRRRRAVVDQAMSHIAWRLGQRLAAQGLGDARLDALDHLPEGDRAAPWPSARRKAAGSRFWPKVKIVAYAFGTLVCLPLALLAVGQVKFECTGFTTFEGKVERVRLFERIESKTTVRVARYYLVGEPVVFAFKDRRPEFDRLPRNLTPADTVKITVLQKDYDKAFEGVQRARAHPPSDPIWHYSATEAEIWALQVNGRDVVTLEESCRAASGDWPIRLGIVGLIVLLGGLCAYRTYKNWQVVRGRA